MRLAVQEVKIVCSTALTMVRVATTVFTLRMLGWCVEVSRWLCNCSLTLPDPHWFLVLDGHSYLPVGSGYARLDK